MGEARRKKERRPAIKPTDKLPPLQVAKDRAISDKQKAFCRQVIDEVLGDDSSLSFSKPVNELWDMSVLSEYFEKIQSPMDLGTVRKRVVSSHYLQPATELFDPNAYRIEARLVFLNAISYNGKSSDLGRLATKFLHFIDAELAKLPRPDSSPTSPSPQPAHTPSRSADPNDHSQHNADDETPSKGPDKTSNRASGEPKLEDSDDQFSKDKHDADMEERAEAKSDDKADDDDEDDDDDDDHAPSADPNEDNDDESKEATTEDSERERVEREIALLNKVRSRANATIAEIELEKNVPLSFDENSKLRDDVEALHWDLSQKVVQILRKYVDEALSVSGDNDPEYVTLEFSTVEPRLLREIEALIRPDARLEKEKQTVSDAERNIDNARRKLKRMGDNSVVSGKKKRSKKSR